MLRPDDPVTILAWIAIIAAIAGETHYYLTPQPQAEVGVDRTGIQKMDVDFKILLPDLPCDNFGVDALDSSGNMLLELQTNIKKTPLGTSRGCRVVGKISVNKCSAKLLTLGYPQVAGEFHIGFGRDSEPVHKEGLDSIEGNHIHKFNMQQARDFNTTHIVEHLGYTVPLSRHSSDTSALWRMLGMRADRFPMNGHSEFVPKNTARFLYFINVITVENNKWSAPIYGYEYVWRLHRINVDTNQPRFWQPGLFFKYELEPYVMTYGWQPRSLIELPSNFYQVGGIYVVAGWVSSLLYYMQKKHGKTLITK